MVTQKAFYLSLRTPAANGKTTVKIGDPGRTEAHPDPGLPEIPREPLDERGRVHDGFHEPDGAGLQHRVGEGGARGDRAQDAFEGGGKGSGAQGSNLAGEAVRGGRRVAPPGRDEHGAGGRLGEPRYGRWRVAGAAGQGGLHAGDAGGDGRDLTRRFFGEQRDGGIYGSSVGLRKSGNPPISLGGGCKRVFSFRRNHH
jgi:hypothetical protein